MIRRLRFWLILKLAGTESAVINATVENLSTTADIRNCLFIANRADAPALLFPNVRG